VTVLRRGRPFGVQQRLFVLPDDVDVDRVAAGLDSRGVLKVRAAPGSVRLDPAQHRRGAPAASRLGGWRPTQQ
jgi:hypothetical protein